MVKKKTEKTNEQTKSTEEYNVNIDIIERNMT